MNLTDYNAAAIDAVTSVMRPRTYPEAAEIIADLRWQADRGFSNSDASIAARALKADMIDGTRKWPDGSEVVHSYLTDGAQELLHCKPFYVELGKALLGDDADKLGFARWLCTVYSAEVAAYVRRLVNDEIES